LREKGFGVGSFFFKIQNPPNLGELKNCTGGGFWRVYELFKFNLSLFFPKILFFPYISDPQNTPILSKFPNRPLGRVVNPA